MAGESIEIDLSVPDSFFTGLDRRFREVGRNASRELAAPGGLGAGRGVADGGGAGPGGSGGGMGVKFGEAAAEIFRGARAGIAATPPAASSSPGVLAQNAAMGAAQGAVSVLKTGIGGIGAIAGGALGGPTGAVAGQAAGTALGELIQSQFNSVKEAMEVPTERGVARLKSIYGNFAAAGVTTTREEREQAIRFSIQIERRRYEGERNLERQYREIAARDSASFGLSWLGR